MRLKTLTMTAFGPFKEKTTVDFDRLGTGLYLIRGNTGAGKTTVFDAIVFALYGVSSGGARTPAMMHSDFVGKSVDAAVTLVFEHGGTEFSVTRKQHFTQHKDGTTSADTPVAELLEPGKAPIRNSGRVNARVQELLGLDAAQFGQIVMLAQGEFRRFLEADSQARGAILSRIFDTSEYAALAARFKAAADKLAQNRKYETDSMLLAVRNMALPDGLSDEEKARLRPVERQPDGTERVVLPPAYDDVLAAFLEREKDAAEKADAAYAELDGELSELGRRKAEAEFRNGRLDALDAARGKKKELDGRKVREDARSDALARGGRAAPVREAENAVRDAQTELVTAEGEVESSEKRLRFAEGENETAGKESGGLDASRRRVPELAAAIDRLEKALPGYDTLDKARSKLSSLRSAAETDREKETKQTTEAGRLAAEIGRVEKELEPLSGAAADVEAAKAADAAARRNRQSFQDVLAAVSAALQTGTELETARRKLEELAADALSKKDAWSGLYSAFFRGQAGLMAGNLEEDIAKTGTGTCPVCGTVHSSVGTGFARKDPATPAETDVETAKNAFDAAERARAGKDAELAELQAKMAEREANAVRDVRKLPGCETAGWKELADETWRKTRAGGFADAAKAAGEKLAAENGRLARKGKLEAEKTEKGKRKAEAEEEAKAAGGRAAKAETEAAALEGKIGQLETGLEHKTKAEAEKALAAAKKERDGLLAEIGKAEERVKKAGEELAAAKAALEAKEKRRDECDGALADRRREFAGALSGAYADDEAAYRKDAALLPADGVQGWLTRLAAEVAQYGSDVGHNAEDLARLEKETAGWTRADVQALDRASRTKEAERKAADENRARLRQFADHHRKILDGIRKSKAELARTEAGMKRLGELSQLATGGTGSGTDRVDFVRWMLGDSLREVLEQANVRLDEMSGGRFELVHRAEGKDKRGAAGLDIDVLDHATGVQRRASTFSGGEGFVASMSLALGLADVVRNHAGDVQLDSLFIDEGFGSLDESVLESCVRVLRELSGGTRQVGVVSHVAKLEEDVWPQLVVEKGPDGSTVRIDER